MKAVTCARIQIERVELLQFLDSLHAGLIEWSLSIKGMEHDALEEISQGHVVVISKGAQYLQEPLLETHPCLDPYDR